MKRIVQRTSGFGCLFQLILLLAWGLLGSWFIELFLDMLVGEDEHQWNTVNVYLQWVAGVFLGKFALLGLLIGVVVGAAIGFPLVVNT